MHAVVGDELGGGACCRAGGTTRGQRSMSLGVDEGSVVVRIGQQSGSSLAPIFAGDTEICNRRAVVGIVLARPLQSVLQREGDRSSGNRSRARVLALSRQRHLCKTRASQRQRSEERR